MVQKSGDHQLSLVVYPIIYKVSKTSKRWLGMGFLNHQQYFWKSGALYLLSQRTTE